MSSPSCCSVAYSHGVQSALADRGLTMNGLAKLLDVSRQVIWERSNSVTPRLESVLALVAVAGASWLCSCQRAAVSAVMRVDFDSPDPF